jgi:hypothetical protein
MKHAKRDSSCQDCNKFVLLWSYHFKDTVCVKPPAEHFKYLEIQEFMHFETDPVE